MQCLRPLVLEPSPRTSMSSLCNRVLKSERERNCRGGGEERERGRKTIHCSLDETLQGTVRMSSRYVIFTAIRPPRATLSECNAGNCMEDRNIELHVFHFVNLYFISLSFYFDRERYTSIILCVHHIMGDYCYVYSTGVGSIDKNLKK